MFKFWGKVQSDNKRGKSLGFPTANVNLHKNIPEGIYVSRTKLDKKEYPSVTFIGVAKTFNDKSFKSETFILDFNRDIYNRWISVILLKKIRGNKKFDSPDKLIEQMKQDEKKAREYRY